MKRTLRIFLLLALVVVGLAACKKSRPGKPRVLVFTKTGGFRHSSIPVGIKAIQKLGLENGFDVDTTENAAKFNEDTLAQYAAVIFLNTTGDVLDNYQEADFERYIQAGGGYVGVHAAADTEYEWGWYNHLAGAWFQSHPPGVHKAIIDVIEKSFPATEGLPEKWEHTDEWYNYKDVDTTTTVLLKLDEKSYQGGTMKGNHPISWYHDYDGGRAFYTGLGHTEESYTDSLFLKHLAGGIKYAIGKNQVLDYSAAKTLRVPEEDRFTKNVLVSGEFFEPTEMAILPNLDILVAQRRGELMLYNAAEKKLSQVGFLKVYHHTDVPKVNAEEGFLGLAADPDFKNNHYIYAMYSPVDTSVNRLSRFKFENNKLDMSSEKVILQFYSQRDICCHTGGSIAFGPGGLLYLSTGDNTTPFDEPGQKYVSKGYGPTDDRPGHLQYDDRRGSANTNDLRGKIIRIKVEADGSYTIPDGNLFPKGTKGTRPEIYAMGTRNPYRMSVDQKTGYVYWGEVGPDANNDDSLRGPRGYDEINQAKKPGFFGYPMFIANNKPYRQYNYETGESGPYFDPLKPINDSRNNTGLKELPPATPAFIWYPYAKSDEFPIVGSGGRNAEAGPIYHSEFYPKETRFPDYYNDKLFIYDWIRGWVMAVTMDKNGNFSKMEKFIPNTKLNAPIDMEMGPDGRLYILEYGNGWFSKNADAGLSRIDFNGGNRAPVANIHATRTTGGLPFKVKLTAEGSKDPDGDKLTYLWNFGNGTKKETTEPTVEYTYSAAGEYPVFVEVADDKGAKTKSKSIDLYAGNETPDVKINITGNQMFYFPGKPVQYTVNISDKEDGNSADGKLDANNIFVKADYVEGRDKAAQPQGHQIITGAIAGKNIMEVSDCKTCHKPDEKSIGPSFKQITEKYKDDPAAPEMLAKKIINGGGGVWGETAMSAHPGISLGEAKQLVEYIYSIGGNAPKVPSLPVNGSINPTLGGEAKDNGVLYLLASYTDKGGPGIKPITGTAAAELLSPKLAAADFSKADGMAVFAVNGTKFLIPSNTAGWATYNNLDLTGVSGIELAYMVQETPQSGYIVEAFLDDANGTRLGEVTIGPGAQPKAPNKVNFNFTPVADGKKHNLYFRYKAIDAAQKVQLGIVSFTLHP
ncbi:ThuA domain-containing protein [Chitinophaga ginsengisegetis]|uniref:ThuA domain-containing protein n=1 Tax=Chitinophaga ginsengisegetis TaxID=393003 RepID=UPI000DBA1E1B|nr:ThuA domain-containing protein [Chitinophaga ginsengisegetis]MDR6565671.1 glucose/arabinose dehydrogenase/cytochrome c551/c552/type 1 glutamine amidotransferase [Chitinophaga ginsengisegetis]MDR6645400.1 glucose/arabinose dehydrogenase/cytochrome c551/c552/type 1 glutamine amidotransferase [Chitinophaga ginsengisegetis]MDR6652008.1 glucose/arabinose dehydrogenase/cytochrome c551/c552/type 1 glutamine amidotransferase [Chitinophaga ginsengisegetis]